MASHAFPGEHVYEGFLLESMVTEGNVEQLKHFSSDYDDILVASYPKTGTTWISELVNLVTDGGSTDQVLSKQIFHRIFYLEYTVSAQDRSGVDLLKDAKRPAILKTHFPASVLQYSINTGKLKVILVVRNPKDTLVSFYHFYKNSPFLGKFWGSFTEFLELHNNKRVIYGGYFDWYESWLPYLNKPNILVVHYEEMKTDIEKVIHRLCRFLGKELAEEKIAAMVEHTSFQKMKANDMVNFRKELYDGFIRKGEVGDWKNYFSAEQSRVIEEEYQRRLEAKGFKVKFELA